MKKKMLIPLFALTLALTFTACDGSDVNDIIDSGSNPNPSTTVSDTLGSASEQISDSSPSTSQQIITDEQIDEAKAKEIALNHAGVKADSITNYRIEKDLDKGVLSYEIEFKVGNDKYEYDILAKTGKILEAEKNDKSLLAETYKKISEDKAKEVALNHAGLKAENITNYKIEFDVDDGVPSYEIEFKSGGYEYDYDINSSDGKIIKSEKEIDD